MKATRTATPEMLRSMATEKLLDLWEATGAMKYTPELAIIRHWLLDEL